MTDLPIATPSPAPATGVRALLRAAPARDVPSAGTSPFQDALALELGLGLAGLVLPGFALAAAAALADGSLAPGEDSAQAAFAADAPPGAALAGMPLLTAPAYAPDAGAAAALVAAAQQDPLAGTPSASRAKPGLSGAAAAADFAASGKFSAAVAGEIARNAAGQGAGLILPGAALAADPALPGKSPRGAAGELAPGAVARKSAMPASIAAAAADVAAAAKSAAPAAAEIRREVAFAASLLEQHQGAPAPMAAAAVHGGSAAAAELAPAPAAAIEARVGERGWDQGLGDKMVWMAGQKQQVAELHLNPPDLGPLKIKLTLSHEHASAQFVSAHAQVREAIEAAMPRLREMLADSGITLGNTSVGTDAFREQAQPQQEPRAYAGRPGATAAESAAVSRGERELHRARGLVDTFA